jgi:hypothetical protein
MQDRIELESKGFYSVDKYMELKAKKKHDTDAAPTPEFDDIIDPRILLREESEEGSDGETGDKQSLNSNVSVGRPVAVLQTLQAHRTYYCNSGQNNLPLFEASKSNMSFRGAGTNKALPSRDHVDNRINNTNVRIVLKVQP